MYKIKILYYTQHKYKIYFFPLFFQIEFKDLGLRCPQKIYFFQRDLLRSCDWAVGWKPIAHLNDKFMNSNQQFLNILPLNQNLNGLSAASVSYCGVSTLPAGQDIHLRQDM